MAKQLLIQKAGNNAAFADTNLKLSKTILLDEIEFHEDFKSLFEIDQEVLKRIVDSMKKNTYDNSQPVHIWVIDGHKYLIDGHTRFTAAKAAGLKAIPYFEHRFATLEEAYRYALSLQVDRRNLDSKALLVNVSKLLGTDSIQNAEGNKAEAIAEIMDVSPRTVTKAIAVEKDEEAKAKVESGEMTVNQAYNEIQKKKKAKAESSDSSESSDEFDPDDLTADSSEGSPAALNFNHSDGFDRPDFSKDDGLDKWLVEKNIQIESAKKEGFADGLYKGVYFVLGEILKGRTPKEIYEDERIADFSPSVVDGFELPEENEDLVSNL